MGQRYKKIVSDKLQEIYNLSVANKNQVFSCVFTGLQGSRTASDYGVGVRAYKVVSTDLYHIWVTDKWIGDVHTGTNVKSIKVYSHPFEAGKSDIPMEESEKIDLISKWASKIM